MMPLVNKKKAYSAASLNTCNGVSFDIISAECRSHTSKKKVSSTTAGVSCA